MAEIVHSKNGTVKITAKSVKYTGQFIEVPQLMADFNSPLPISFEVGDYIVFSYDGIKYSIMEPPTVTKQGSAGSVGDAFVYENIIFKSPLGLLSNIDFLDTVLNENNVHYSTLPIFEFFGTIKDFADRLQANINRLHTGWKISIEGYDDSANSNYDILHEYKNVSISNISCIDSLSVAYDTWGISYVFMVDDTGNNCIVFNHTLDKTSNKRYGKGNGLYTIEKRMSTEKPIANRLRAYGSTENLPARYYNNLEGIDEGIYIPNLLIPRSKWKDQNKPITAYIDSTDIDDDDTSISKYGIREKSVYFDGSDNTEKIEPSIKGVTAGMIRTVKAEIGDTSNVPSETLYPDNERMDKVVEAEVLTDNGIISDGELYSVSSDMTIPNEGNGFIILPTNRKISLTIELETDFSVTVPATYRFTPKSTAPVVTISGVGANNQFSSLNPTFSIYSISDSEGNVAISKHTLLSTFQMKVDYSQQETYFYLSGGQDDRETPFFVRIANKGRLSFRINISGIVPNSISGKLPYKGGSVLLNVSQGPLILQDTFWIKIKQIGFDINSYLSSEEAKIVVNSGLCAGRSFNIKKNSISRDRVYKPGLGGTEIIERGWSMECFRSIDESLNQYFPNEIDVISKDDEFVLTGLEMPELYVMIASQRLYDEGVKWLKEHKDGLEIFDLDIDSKVAYLDSVKIKEGMLMPLYDSDLNIGSKSTNSEGETVIRYENRVIDSVTVEIGEEPIPKITAVLREEKWKSGFKSLIGTVDTILKKNTQNALKAQMFNIAEEVVRDNTSTQVYDILNNAVPFNYVESTTEQTIVVENESTYESPVQQHNTSTIRWTGRISNEGAIKTGGVDTIEVSHTTEGTYLITGLPVGCVVAITPVISESDIENKYTALVKQNADNGNITVYTYTNDGIMKDCTFLLIAI